MTQPTPITDAAELDEIEARCNAATLVGWRAESSKVEGEYLIVRYGGVRGDVPVVCVGRVFDLCDATFIAHARQDVPRLTAIVRHLQEELTQLRAENERLQTNYDRLQKACDIFEHNSANAAELYDACYRARVFIENLTSADTEKPPLLERLRKLTQATAPAAAGE